MKWRAAVIITFVLMGAWGTLAFQDTRDGAAWIQCIWSIIAVFLAIIVPQWHAEVSSRHEERRKVRLLTEILASCIQLMEDASRELKTESLWILRGRMLAAFPVEALASSEQIRDLMTFKDDWQICIHSVHAMQNVSGEGPIVDEVWEDCLTTIASILERNRPVVARFHAFANRRIIGG